MNYNISFNMQPESYLPSGFNNFIYNEINDKISCIEKNCDKYNYLKKNIISKYINIKKIIDKEKTEIECTYLIQLCNIICEKYLYEIYMSNELYNIILEIHSMYSINYIFNDSFKNINNEMEKIKKNMFIKRQYSRVINGYGNYENDLTQFFKKYCGLRKFIGNKLMSF